jgi:hypothetical protein
VRGIFCYLEEVFDCVNHDILLSTLNFYGITGKFRKGCNHSLGIGKSKPILFVNDSSVMITNYNLEEFKNDVKIGFESLTLCRSN